MTLPVSPPWSASPRKLSAKSSQRNAPALQNWHGFGRANFLVPGLNSSRDLPNKYLSKYRDRSLAARREGAMQVDSIRAVSGISSATSIARRRSTAAFD